jgi:hypothetical protein
MSSESDGGNDQVESTGLFKGIHYVRYGSGTMNWPAGNENSESCNGKGLVLIPLMQ